MSLAFDLKNDKKEREDNPLQPFELVSLWQLLEFYADTYTKVCRLLVHMNTAIRIARSEGHSVADVGRPSAPLLKGLQWLHTLLTEMELRGPASNAERLLRDLRSKKPVSSSQYQQATDILMQGLADELQGQLFLAIRPARAKFYRMKGTFLGSNTISRLRDVETDALEAGNCFALGRYSSCAFHLMRIMEHVTYQFAEKVRATTNPNEDTFGDILGKIRTKISEWDRGRRPSPVKKKYFACYESIAHLCSRRNDIMHIREHYSEERANDLMGAVKTSIEDYLKLPDPPLP